MGVLPQINARLTAITGGGGPRQYGVAGVGGSPKWAGNEPAYVIDKIRSTISNDTGALLRVKDTTLIIPPDVSDVRAGDHVTYTLKGVDYTREVGDVSEPVPPAGGLSLHTYVKLHLVPSNA